MTVRTMPTPFITRPLTADSFSPGKLPPSQSVKIGILFILVEYFACVSLYVCKHVFACICGCVCVCVCVCERTIIDVGFEWQIITAGLRNDVKHAQHDFEFFAIYFLHRTGNCVSNRIRTKCSKIRVRRFNTHTYLHTNTHTYIYICIIYIYMYIYIYIAAVT